MLRYCNRIYKRPLFIRSLHYQKPSYEDAVEYFSKRYNDKKNQYIISAQNNNTTILTMAKDPISVISKELSQNNNNIENTPDSIYGLGRISQTQTEDVFINNELNLDIPMFTYTVANYTEELSKTIYDIIKNILVDLLRYPSQIKDFQFDPHFAIRGLHYDYNNGWLMKIDNMANIQLNTVHVGRESIKNPQEVIELHNGLHIPPAYLNNNMFQLSDLFSIPQSCILSDVLQYFKEKDISFHPRYLSDDISQAAKILHTGLTNLGSHGIGGRLHAAINKDISKYLEPSPKVVSFLENLRKNGKKTFLLTNSTLPFIDIGMTYLTSSPDWRDLFDCVIVSARKPDFYHSRLPFRHTSDKWGSVNSFEPGQIYSGGNVNDFSRLTGWSGQRVLYFGDHIFSDLLDPSVNGWRTGAIIHELAEEINIRNTSSYRHTLSWLLRLEQLLNEAQSYQPENRPLELNSLIQEWRHERSALRLELKVVFNRHFGSVFRTHNNPTYFANKLRKFADIYTSNITNLQNIPGDYVFFPNRTYLPHERVMETLVDTGRFR
ncbi:unnamed protein product [Cunninghamella echinulata]